METEYEIIDTSTNALMSIEDKLLKAVSGEEIKQLLIIGNNARPSGTTRRRWLRAAATSYARLREAQARPAQETSLIAYCPNCEQTTLRCACLGKGQETNHSAAGDEGEQPE